MLEGVVLNGVDEGLWHWVHRELSQHFDQHQAEDEVDGKLLSLRQVVFVSLADWKRGICGFPVQAKNNFVGHDHTAEGRDPREMHSRKQYGGSCSFT